MPSDVDLSFTVRDNAEGPFAVQVMQHILHGQHRAERFWISTLRVTTST